MKFVIVASSCLFILLYQWCTVTQTSKFVVIFAHRVFRAQCWRDVTPSLELKRLFISPTQHICWFCKNLNKQWSFHKRHLSVCLCTGDALCFLLSRNWRFKYILCQFLSFNPLSLVRILSFAWIVGTRYDLQQI